MDIYSIYQITCQVNGKKYIGYTKKDVNARLSEHVAAANRGRKTILYNAMRKYGTDAFLISCIYQTKDFKHAKQMEKHFIAELNSFFENSEGYNMTYGGDGGDTSSSPNFLAGIANRDITGPRNGNYGGFSDEHRKNLSASKKGKRPGNYDKFIRNSAGKSYFHDNDNQQEGRFFADEVPTGWTKGRLKHQCVCGKWADKPNLSRHHRNC